MSPKLSLYYYSDIRRVNASTATEQYETLSIFFFLFCSPFCDPNSRLISSSHLLLVSRSKRKKKKKDTRYDEEMTH